MRQGLQKASIASQSIISRVGPGCPQHIRRVPGPRFPLKHSSCLLSLTLSPQTCWARSPRMGQTWGMHSFSKPLLSARHCARSQELRHEGGSCSQGTHSWIEEAAPTPGNATSPASLSGRKHPRSTERGVTPCPRYAGSSVGRVKGGQVRSAWSGQRGLDSDS
ncbi:hypothetical protein VULLAG_LOCUS10207 [Vulpes lagopus]